MILDASFSVQAQITNFARTAFFQLPQVKQLTLHLSHTDPATVIHAMFTSRLNYYNLLYVGLFLKLTWKHQLVQIAAVWVLTRDPKNGMYLTRTVQAILLTSGTPDQVQGFGAYL